MFLAGMFLAAVARSLASPTPVAIPSSPIPSPLCAVTAALSAGACDPNKKRTIFDIVYSCLGVIFLCTYISIHHNIPDQNDSWAKKTWLKIRTMLYAMVAPEVVIMWALRQRIMAGKIADEYKECGWTKTHGFFVQMGGLMLEGEETGKYKVVESDYLRRKDQVIEIFRWPGQVIGKVPKIRTKEIQDRGKGDILSKAIVVLQTSWFVVQCIARCIEGLALTELELVTLAFAALNAVTYVLWWDKPLSVEYPIYVDKEGKRVDGPEEEEEEAWYTKAWKVLTGSQSGGDRGEEGVGLLEGPQKNAGSERYAAKSVWKDMIKKPFVLIFGPLFEMTNVEETGRKTSVHSFYAAALDADQHRLAYFVASVIGIIFGGIHLIGWNFSFLTATELWLWRASSLVLTVVPAIIAISWPLKVDWWSVENSDPFIHRVLWFLVARIGTPLYVAARVVILLLAFFSLRDLPDSAFDNIKWSNFIPHI
ncbi:hypothetical protein AX16_006380 [Volvariella volvacea WC 439]|nr:hypothetical protein AX16_006380 [Volvariella volvacea WC 439]